MKKIGSVLLLLTAVIVFNSGCSKDANKSQLSSKTFVLVHGAWQASWVWQKVKQQLEDKRQKVIVVELPGHGDDATPPQSVSMDVYRDKVIDALNATKENVILVGHSMGGMVVSAVAEKVPAKIEKLIYIGAFVPADGQSILDIAAQDKQSSLGASIIPSADQLTLDIKKDSIVPVFCQDAPNNVQQQMLQKFRAEPAIPFANKVQVTAANFGSVPKYYIHTTQDHAISLYRQNAMAAAANITNTYSLNTSHSPFLSEPDEVTKLLLRISR